MKRESLPELDSVALLTAILSELKSLNDKFDKLGRPSLSDHDREAITALVSEISMALGSDEFNCSQLLEYASGDRDLLSVIEQTTGPIDEGSTRRIGRLLAKAERHRLDGLHVERRSLLWCVVSNPS